MTEKLPPAVWHMVTCPRRDSHPVPGSGGTCTCNGGYGWTAGRPAAAPACGMCQMDDEPLNSAGLCRFCAALQALQPARRAAPAALSGQERGKLSTGMVAAIFCFAAVLSVTAWTLGFVIGLSQ
jgi:hypothetical protein